MKGVKSVMKSITKVLTCPVILWPLMVVILIQGIPFMGLGGADYDRSMLRIEYENAPKGTVYVEKAEPGQGAI